MEITSQAVNIVSDIFTNKYAPINKPLKLTYLKSITQNKNIYNQFYPVFLNFNTFSPNIFITNIPAHTKIRARRVNQDKS